MKHFLQHFFKITLLYRHFVEGIHDKLNKGKWITESNLNCAVYLPPLEEARQCHLQAYYLIPPYQGGKVSV